MPEDSKLYIGVDPGVNGGYAITEGRFPNLAKPCPYEAAGIWEVVKHWNPETCIVGMEVVHSSPQQGVASAHTFGRNRGHWEMALAARNIVPIMIRSQDWQAAFNCRTAGDKKITRDLAHHMFANVSVTLKTADALLISYYTYLKYGKLKEAA